MIPFDAPIYMAPAAGMLFLIGAFILNFGGLLVYEGKPGGWIFVNIIGIAVQILAFAILINL